MVAPALLPSLDTPKDRQLACRHTLAAGARPARFKWEWSKSWALTTRAETALLVQTA